MGVESQYAARRSAPKGYDNAHRLRKNLTPAEKKLWVYLRGDKLNNINFRRQHAIGNYVVDFCSIKQKIIIELDGSQHLEQTERDDERTRYLQSQGYKVIRFWNNAVMNDINAVIEVILDELKQH